MDKADRKKIYDRSVPESSFNKDLKQSYESVEEHEDRETTLETCSASIPPNKDHTRELSIFHHLIVERYEGDKSGDVFHGEGVAYFQGGHVYKGSFSHGLMHGHGEYIWSDGLKYQGDFKSNVLMGCGTYSWTDGSTYEGEVHNGIRHGVGTYKCAKTNTVYTGQWCLGKRKGKGIMYYNQASTSWYEGDWIYNSREGWGVRQYPSGNVYEGQWSNNVQHGEGKMKWIQLNQQYSGQWVNGIQDGNGTYTWFRKRVPCSLYPCMNEYSGEFVQRMRHGRGKFSYASGAVYSGEWRHDKKHRRGKYTFEDGRIYEGEFAKDCIVDFPAFTPGMSTPSTPYPDDSDLPKRLLQSSSSSSLLGPDMTLNIQTLLNRLPETHRDQELRQVEFAVLRHIGLLREIYSFYSSLGHEQTPEKTFPLTQLQFLRFLKDCKGHPHGMTLAQIDRLIKEELDGVGSPFTTILPRECISYIIITAYHIYCKDIESSKNLLEACFSKLLRQNIIPNAKNVKGPLFRYPVHSVVACYYTERCWNIYQALCKANSAQILTVRQFILMLKDLCIYDDELTASKVLEIVSVEDLAIYDGTHSNLELEMTFLEFFEALLGCAEVKGKKTQTAENGSDTDHQYQTVVPSHEMAQLSRCERPEQRLNLALASKEAAECTVGEVDLEGRIQKTKQFLSQTFIPAYEHSVKVKELMKEERLKLKERNGISLAKSARQKEQCEAEEGQKDDDGDKSPDHYDSPPLPPPPMNPLNSTTSVVSKESPISQRMKKQ
ncbi:radial spoke head 10 homolog B isoform X1 [Triplophysa dalaica]|uniref:radial spoke head 10 homolog B isoform X1 n=1 Tax=Triplophysa dalaica TaxID=1582913 RepID=UPI0024DF8ECF|nr:radial spoke head 10 homolog B isoform X1 [Triplophysa dalaica]XP_056627983.1 radial spoke head 10 homolog B isoform X1 [Triplophysa dalaica]